ncbi:hypothetical protein EKH77_11835 [Streptomyces luteoverticillatus]|uniref:Uncharacterized protein n=1 Tax=Streptomyces luteoverticillatus TaxID=66425 RepID=A0A3Q9FVA2_STRLT|nr:hypothetical protein [Streptomyces luteoverticillatus]AZQ71808.1 hypothetical protein EKH77_11835 [Streptomyces luteoverticillatus]
MPLSYQDVMTADLSPLLNASESWQKMGKRFGELKGDYERNVQRALANGNWQGASFTAHQNSSIATASEYAAASTEALAVADILAQAHTELARLQKAVKDLVAEAEDKDYKVDSAGKATYVGFDKLSAAEQDTLRRDPDYPKLMAQAQQTAQAWTDGIAKAVHAVDETDQSVQRALTRATIDHSAGSNGFGGFNAHAEGTLAKAGAPEVSATKTDGWEITTTGPKADFTSTDSPSYGKEGRFKAYADLGHVTAKRSLTDGSTDISVVADAYAGARFTGNYGFNNKGGGAATEVSIGGRAMAEVREDHGPMDYYTRAEGFAGGEAGLTAKATKDEVSVGTKRFVGAKAGMAGGFEIAGIGIGGTVEGWAGEGAEGKWGYMRDPGTGKWKIGAKGGAAEFFGGATGVEITVDPDKFTKAVGHAANAVGHAAGSVKNTVRSWF